MKFIFFISMCAFAHLVSAQTTSEYVARGDREFDRKNYASAIMYYEIAINPEKEASRKEGYPFDLQRYSHGIQQDAGESGETKKSTMEQKRHSYAIHRIANCQRLLHNYSLAEEWYTNAIQINWGSDKEYPRDQYWYGEILMNNGKYKEAIDQLTNYILSGKDTLEGFEDRAQRLVDNSRFALSKSSKIGGFVITKADSTINSGNASYGISFSDVNSILLSSARKGNLMAEESGEFGEYQSDLFTLQRNGDKWVDLKSVGAPVNSRHNDGAGVMNKEKNTMFFTRWTGGTNFASLYVSKLFAGKWMTPQKLSDSVNVPGYESKHPALTQDGRFLFFSSNRPGSYGGYDIWYCSVDPLGNPGIPVNAGPEINTSDDEITPFYHYQTSTIYFSSTGHKGIGGFDIFRAPFEIAGPSGQPENLGFPMNSGRDEKYFVLDTLQQSGFFSSNRQECSECTHGNCHRVFQFAKTDNEFLLSGTVYDAQTDQPIPNSRITFKDVKYIFDPYFIETDSNGYYSLPLDPELHIFIKATKNEYFADANVVSTIGLRESSNFNIDFYLAKIPFEEIIIPGIEYDLDKATLRPASKVILDSIVDFLILNDNLVIEISAHTDVRGSDDYNMDLSQRRAQSVVDYMISKEIHKDRLVAKGYGETIPIIKDAQTEEDHQRNRRTSFRTLSQDFQPMQLTRPSQGK